MRIRRRDKDLPDSQAYSPSASAPPGDRPATLAQEHPTAADPVKTLIAEAPPVAEPEAAPVADPEPEEPVADVAPAPQAAGPAARPEPATPPIPAPEAAPEPSASTPPPPETDEATPPVEVATPPASPLPVEEAPAVVAPPAPVATPGPKTPAKGAAQMRKPSIRSGTDDLLSATASPVRELPRVIAIANQKGGVGKTTTTVNLGAALAEEGYRVLVVDLDPQGNATTGLGIDARNFELSMYDVIMRDQPLEDCIEPTSVKNLFVAPATIDLAGFEIELVPAFSRELKLKRAIDAVVDDFDFILIDCPPSLGLITVNGLAAAGEVLVPIQCEYYALEGLSQLLRNVNLVSSNLNESLEVSTIVLTMFDARTRLSIDVANEVREHFADRVCRSVIPRTVRLSEAPSFGQPITVFDPTSRGAVAYRELAKEVSNGAPQRSR